MSKLTDTQLVILSATAKRTTGAVLPLPTSLKANKGATTNSIRSLIKRGLIAERPAKANDVIWWEEDDARLTLVITDAGLGALGIDPGGVQIESVVDAERPAKRSLAKSANGQGSKQAILIDLLHRPDGASIDELGSALGWQAHSVRGAIAGTVKKKLGFDVISEKDPERGRVYRIVTDRKVAA